MGWSLYGQVAEKYLDPPKRHPLEIKLNAQLVHHSPKPGGSAPQKVVLHCSGGARHLCRPFLGTCTAGPSLPNTRGKCPQGGKLLCWGGAHADFSPGKKRTWCINPHGGGAPLHIPPQEQSGAGASLPNIRGKCPQGGQRRCWGGSHADFSPGKKSTWCINPHWGGAPLQIPPGAKRG